MTGPANSGWDRETRLLAVLAACASVVAFLACFQSSQVLLYGDAVAHINIARRVFDSRTPGLLQLGTVWLPLPHLLMIPFLIGQSAWQSGWGGSIPSMIAYVFGVVGIFRLVRDGFGPGGRIAAWLAAAAYGANPNLLYLQSTAMTEAIYLAFFIWAVLYFAEFARAEDEQRISRLLLKCGLCLAGACLTRYDGWFLTVVVCAMVVIVILRKSHPRFRSHGVVRFFLVAAAAPVLWLLYNGIVYRNPLEFANGPYSAKAIEHRSLEGGEVPHPGSHQPLTAAAYFLKSAELNLAPGNWGRLWLAVLLLGLFLCAFQRDLWPWFLFIVPLPFYVLSIAYVGVPIYLPAWWPFTHYNVRYGIEMLPAVAVFLAILIHFALSHSRTLLAKAAIAIAAVALIASSYTGVWRAEPIALTEARINSRSRIALERELTRALRTLPPDSSVLMYLGDHVGAVQQAGIPLRQLIQEGNHRTWRQPSDPSGLWERALADPVQYADFIVAIGDDPVALAVRDRGLPAIVVIHASGQPPATIYRGRLAR